MSRLKLWGAPQELVRALGGNPDDIRCCRIKLGSLSLLVSYTDEKYLTMLEELLRLRMFPAQGNDVGWQRENHLLLFDVDSKQFRAVIPRPSQPLVDRPLDEAVEIHHLDACCLAGRSEAGLRLVIPVAAPTSAQYSYLLHCVMVVLYRGLFALGSLPLHSAAVQIGDTANLFIGDKGAGKTTISLHLGLAGGRVLAEDYVLLRRADGRFLVSGCDGKGRLTARTEDHFFPSPLPIVPQDVAGTLKKEIELADYVCSVPFEDVPVGRLFFLRAGKELRIQPMRGTEALLKMLGTLRERQHVVGADDGKTFLDFCSELLESAEVWDLTLSPDLNDLDELARFVKVTS